MRIENIDSSGLLTPPSKGGVAQSTPDRAD
jgi:hypothetical protein